MNDNAGKSTPTGSENKSDLRFVREFKATKLTEMLVERPCYIITMFYIVAIICTILSY